MAFPRSRTLLCALLGAALLTPVTPASTASVTPDSAVSGPLPVAEDRTVDYRGLRLTVPGEWRVVDLDRNPAACLRLDLPTLYLGPAGTQGECTGRAVATRADTLHLEPLDGAPPRADIPTVTIEDGTAVPPPDRTASHSNELRYALRRAGIMATVSYGAAPDAVRGVLTRARRTAAGTPGAAGVAGAPGPDGAATVRAAALTKARTGQDAFTGQGFDACTAPTQGAMDNWRDSAPFGAVGVYIGGRARACAQPQLTASWVRRQAAAGWHLMPIWVGPQPWHSNSTGLSTDPHAAEGQGRSAAEGAVAAARTLGLSEGTVLYNDVENYQDRATWDAPVVAYVSAWTVRLRELGYHSAAYVSAGSGVKALSARYSHDPEAMPDVLWVAHWNGSASVSDTDMGLPSGTRQWTGPRRAHQFRGGHNASYGGVTINIDSNWVDVDPGALDGGPDSFFPFS
ncbi:DUF1906 domain-containing protein [Streptomyces sp. NPDC051567]|uniref:DUF1906 domain-containing protein n=1 Tax=Streptomyces sp. NPDC051567 TaxID=3365660 RepID=UPI00379C3471